jgi:uncharacterized protein YndB with AHSA1/START domain
MPVKRDDDGRRYVEAEVEVKGTPDEVWRAIATGAGISAWFVPTTSDEKVGGKAVSSFGPGMDSVATITRWEPPRRFDAETDDQVGKIATEWHVETRAGGTCVVRVVHRWFADSDDWDAQFEGYEAGWADFFRILALYLAHFAGERSSLVQLAGFSAKSPIETWQEGTSALRLDSGARRFTSAPDAPTIAGAIERARSDQHHELLLRLEKPAPGLAHVFVMPMGERTMFSLRFFLYGERGAKAAPGVEREWSEWLGKRFPAEVTQ